jgi:hypothetical protein
MEAFQYHDAMCVVAGLAIPAVQQITHSLYQQRLNYTLVTKDYVTAVNYLTTLLFVTIIQRR